MKNEGRVVLDIKGLLMRSLHAGTDPDALLGEDGKVYNRAEHGFQNFLQNYIEPILATTPPRLIIAAWDGGSRYRRARFPEYKQHRRDKEKDPKQEEQYEKLYKYAKEFLKSVGAIQAVVSGVEADDLIALLVEKLTCPLVVYTVDGDLSQLSSENCTVIVGGEVVGEEYKGVPTKLVRLYKSIVGDTSDGYPGVKGMGQKAWEKLVENYDIDGMEELDKIVQANDKHGLREAIEGAPDDKNLAKLLENWNEWRLSHDLATLHPFECDRGVESSKTLQKIEWTKRLPDFERAMAVLDDSDCNEFIEMVRDFLPTQKLVTAANMADVSEWLSHVNSGGLVAFDYETWDPVQHAPFQEAVSKGNYVDVLSARITGASFCAGDNYQHTIYVSVDHKGTENCDLEVVKGILEKSQSAHGRLVVQNAMFEMPVTRSNIGDILNAPIDTKLMASYVDENELSGLKHSSWKYLRYKQTTYEEVTKGRQMNEIPAVEVLQYGCDDAFVTAHLADLYFVIMQVEGSWKFFAENEVDDIWPLLESYEAGQRIDYDHMRELEAEDAETVDSGMKMIRNLLEAHCQKESQDRADNLINADLENIRELAREQGKGPDTVKDKVEKFKKRALEGSRYLPLVTQPKKVEFTGTKGQVNEVARLLGFKDEIGSFAASRISEWLSMVYDDRKALGGRAAEFCDLIAGAQKRLAKASKLSQEDEDGYEEFRALCQAVKDENAPVETFGDELNFDSPNQMQEMLYCKLGLPVRVRSKVSKGSTRDKLGLKGSPATDENAVLTALAEDVKKSDWRFEFLTTYKEVKEAKTRIKLYYAKYPLWEHPKDCKIHPQINNCGTVTRRPTGGSPNILQVSKGPVRSIFLPDRDDHVIVSIDFSGEELRIMGSEANDPVFIDAYCGEVKKDIHCVTGAGIAPTVMKLKMGREDLVRKYVTRENGKDAVPYAVFNRLAKKEEDHEDHAAFSSIRKDAKPVNFLISYLGTAPTLAQRLMVPTDTAQAFIDGFFRTYPRIAPWQEEVKQFARDHGYTVTAFGNRRHLSKDLYSKDGSARSRIERQAVNYVIQGCGADILKIVLREIHQQKLLKETGSRLIAPVYDEIVASVPIKAVYEYITRMSAIMSITPPGHAIPMLPEVSIGLTWYPQIELGSYPSADAVSEAVDKVLNTRKAA